MKFRPERTTPLFPELSENPWPEGQIRAGRGKSGLTTLELCAGAGGQALGLERAGIDHAGLIELDESACATLRLNRPKWNVINGDLKHFDAAPFEGVDIVSGGLPCPPFSVAGKQLGESDDRNLFPAMIRIVRKVKPRAVMIENVRGFLDAVFQDYRTYIRGELGADGYVTGWKLMMASDFGVPQLRPRVVFVALRADEASHFVWPAPAGTPTRTVGQELLDLMSANGWNGAPRWAAQADQIAPTIVGGSHKHGGPDLGPTRARAAWAQLGVDGLGIANQAPDPDFEGSPRLTLRMVARLQGFPDEWRFAGTKTKQYRQIGNAFPPPFASAIAESVRACLTLPRLVSVAG